MPAKPFRESGGHHRQSPDRLAAEAKGQKLAEQEERGDLEKKQAPVYWWQPLSGLVWFTSAGPEQTSFQAQGWVFGEQ